MMGGTMSWVKGFFWLIFAILMFLCIVFYEVMRGLWYKVTYR